MVDSLRPKRFRQSAAPHSWTVVIPAATLFLFAAGFVFDAWRSHHDRVVRECQEIAEKTYADPKPCGLTSSDRREIAYRRREAKLRAEAEKLLGAH